MVGTSQSQWPATSMGSRVSRFGDATMGSCEETLQARSAAVLPRHQGGHRLARQATIFLGVALIRSCAISSATALVVRPSRRARSNISVSRAGIP